MPSHARARSRLNHAPLKMADGRSPYRDNFIATFSEDGRKRMLSASLLPPLLSSRPTQNEADDVPISTFYSAPSFLPFEPTLPPCLSRSVGRHECGGGRDAGTTGLSSFCATKSDHIISVGAPQRSAAAGNEEKEAEFLIETVLITQDRPSAKDPPYRGKVKARVVCLDSCEEQAPRIPPD